MTKIGLVTIHYKNLTDTLSLLQSLLKTKVPKGSELIIYVIDNEGSEGLTRVIETDFPGCRLIKSGKNLGFAGGNNLGFKEALKDQADLVIAINNDTFVKEDFFKKVLASPINKPEVGAVSGLIYFAPGFEFKDQYKKNEIGKVIWYAGGKFDWDNVLGSNDHVDEIDGGQFQNPVETAFITGALFITKAEILKKVGLFDDDYFMYLEDVDLCQRIKKAGYKLIFDPGIKIWHKVGQSSGIGSPLNDYFITRNRLLFGFKYTHFRTKFALFREAMRKLITGTPAQKTAIFDFFSGHLGLGSFVEG